MGDYKLEFRHVSKIFSIHQGIRDVSFNVRKGDFHALIGSNGAGKSTIIKCLLNFIKQRSGEVLIDSVLNTSKEAFKSIGFVSDKPEFPNELSAFEFLLWSAKLNQINTEEAKYKINTMAKDLEILDILSKNPNKFSTGQKQKMMLIKVWVENCDFIIMDEPTANLDPENKIIFFNQLKKLNAEGKTILISSHDLRKLNGRVNSVTVVQKGKIVYSEKMKSSENLEDIFKVHALEGK